MKNGNSGTMRDDPVTRIVKDVPFTFNRDRVYRLLGQRGAEVSPRLEKKLERCIREARLAIEPKIVYTILRSERSGGGLLEIEGNIQLKSAKLARTLRGCGRVTVFLATLGMGIDNLISRSIREKKLSDGYMYDAVGSAVVESVVDEFQKRMDVEMEEEGKRTTLRFSPGYCDWKIQDQEKLFEVLDNEAIKVKLNKSCLMEPRKSVSGIFGIGESADIDKEDRNPCKACGMRNCIARRG